MYSGCGQQVWKTGEHGVWSNKDDHAKRQLEPPGLQSPHSEVPENYHQDLSTQPIEIKNQDKNENTNYHQCIFLYV